MEDGEIGTLKRLLWALAKKAGGEIHVDEVEFDIIGPKDQLLIMKDPANRTINIYALGAEVRIK